MRNNFCRLSNAKQAETTPYKTAIQAKQSTRPYRKGLHDAFFLFGENPVAAPLGDLALLCLSARDLVLMSYSKDGTHRTELF